KEEVPLARASKRESLMRYGVHQPANWVTCRKADHKAGDWILMFEVTSGKHLAWMYVDFVVKVTRTERKVFHKDYSYQAVQVHQFRMNAASPPFNLDALARKIVAATVREVGKKRLDSIKTAQTPADFRRCLLKYSAQFAGSEDQRRSGGGL